MWATRRRTIILLIILGAIALFIVLPYWLIHRVPPTCSDGKMNQDERGIDCGGGCAMVCRNDAKELSILWTKVFPVRTGVYDVVAYVENANFNIGAPSVPYVVKLFDGSGALIAEEAGQTYARPEERFVIFQGNVLTGDKIAVSGGIEIPNTFPWYNESKVEQPMAIEDKVLVGADRKPKLTAVLKNKSPTPYRNIDVTAIIYDSKGDPIGVSSTRVEKLEASGSENLFFTWPSPFNYVSEVSRCDVPVDVMLSVDRSGSMVDVGKLSAARIAASQFVDRLSAKDQVGYVSFATDASTPIDQPLTSELERVKRAIEKTVILQNGGIQYTNIADGIQSSVNELATLRHIPDSRPVVVMLTDGIPTRPQDPSNKANSKYPEEYAKKVAEAAKAQGITLYAIGLGADVDTAFLTGLATSPEYYYTSASGAELGDVYQRIATSLCKSAPSVIEVLPRIKVSQ